MHGPENVKKSPTCVSCPIFFDLGQGGNNVLRVIKRGKANFIGHILRGNCLLKHVLERNLRRKGGYDWKTPKKT